jgi:hypothetical protein
MWAAKRSLQDSLTRLRQQTVDLKINLSTMSEKVQHRHGVYRKSRPTRNAAGQDAHEMDGVLSSIISRILELQKSISWKVFLSDATAAELQRCVEQMHSVIIRITVDFRLQETVWDPIEPHNNIVPDGSIELGNDIEVNDNIDAANNLEAEDTHIEVDISLEAESMDIEADSNTEADKPAIEAETSFEADKFNTIEADNNNMEANSKLVADKIDIQADIDLETGNNKADAKRTPSLNLQQLEAVERYLTKLLESHLYVTTSRIPACLSYFLAMTSSWRN